MKRVLVFLLVTLLLVAGSLAQGTPSLPHAPTERVTDTAGFLSEPTRRALSAQLEAHQRASGHQVLVWVGKTTGVTPLEDWTVRAFQAWRVGRKGLDDGLVLFLFAEDRAARIEVGYGLEAQVPDALASRILRDTVIPRLQSGDRDGAVTEGAKQIIVALGGNITPGGNTNAPEAQPLSGVQILLLTLAGIGFIVLAIRNPRLALYLLMIFARGGNGGGSGNSGGGGGKSGGGGASGKW